MQTGLVVRTLEDQQLAIVFSLDMLPFHEKQRNKVHYHVRVQKLSIVPWLLHAMK